MAPLSQLLEPPTIPARFNLTDLQLVIAAINGECRTISVFDPEWTDDFFVTHDSAVLIDQLRDRGLPLPAAFIDINECLKLLAATSRQDGGEPRWNARAILEQYFGDRVDHRSWLELIEIRTKPPNQPEVFRLLSRAALALRNLWKECGVRLQTQREAERFAAIEVPIQNVFGYRQYHGIRVDADVVSAFRRKASDEKFTAYRQVAAALGVSPAGLNFHNVADYLARTDASHLAQFAGQSNIEQYFEIARHNSRFAESFWSYIRADRDLAVITTLGGTIPRAYPSFSSMGSVTARVFATRPRLQELRKRYRSMLIADEGKALTYLDYAQFEPGILASLANDQELRSRYNSADLYAALSAAIFGVEDQRDFCKRLFLAYCFGMSVENLAKLLSGADFNPERLVKLRTTATAFFQAFPGLATFRASQQDHLRQEGFVSSLLGNRRVRQEHGPLSDREQRWAMNHVVQSTASLIFKKAVLKIVDLFGKESVLLPMHDAVLLQLDVDLLAERTEQVREAMIHAFTEVCPDISPKVVVRPFVET